MRYTCCRGCRTSLFTCRESGNCPCHWWQAAKDTKGGLPYKDPTGSTAMKNLSKRTSPKRKRKQR